MRLHTDRRNEISTLSAETVEAVQMPVRRVMPSPIPVRNGPGCPPGAQGAQTSLGLTLRSSGPGHERRSVGLGVWSFTGVTGRGTHNCPSPRAVEFNSRKRLRAGVGPEEAVLLHPVVNLLARHPEELGRFRLVAFRSLEGLHDEVLLEIVEFDARFRQGEKGPVLIVQGSWPAQKDVVGRDRGSSP